ncbi:Tyrosine protein kinase [Entamoeba marina]
MVGLVNKYWEIVGVPENPASFILRLMHHYDIIFIYRRSAAIRLNLKQQFDDMNRQLENVGEIPESMASSLSSSSVSSSSSRQSSKSYLTLTNNTDILIYPSSNLNEMRNDSDWPLSHDNDEVEHGRIYNINGLSRELASLINSTFCLKYRYQKQWKNGVIVTCESGNSNERIYMMVEEDLSNQQITLRMRYLITNVMICFSATKLIQEVEDLLSRITHLEGSSISRVLFICPEKILKGEIETVSEDVILTAIKHNQIELHTSTLHYNLVLCALDRIMTSLNQTKQINIEDFTFIKGITEGSNSQVSLYRCEKDFGEIQKGQEVVIKTATFELFSGFDDKSIAKIELFKRFVGEYLREFSFIEFSPNSALAKVFGYSFSPLCVVMEYCGGGDLFTFLHISTHKFTLKEMLSIAKQVAKALQLLHTSTPPIIHRDLKSPNILLRGVLSENSKKGSKILGDNLNFSNCAVTDFGMSVSGNEIGSPVECPYWLAPECISHSNFSPASDIYAFAIVLWELQSREPPFQKLKFFSEVRDHVLAGGRLPLIDNDKLLPYNSLIRSCWNHNPSLRPSSTQVLNELDNMLKLL